MKKNKQQPIGSRIKQVMVSLTLGLSLIFGLLIFLLVYVIEDQVFINLLKSEGKHFKNLSHQQALTWQPASRSMKLFVNKDKLPKKLHQIVLAKTGVYEYFEDAEAYFILFDQKQYSEVEKPLAYYIVYDVSDLLVVRSNRFNLINMIMAITFLVMIAAIFIAMRLSKNILTPLRKLTDQLQNEGYTNMQTGFSLPFAGDEIGILAAQLEAAIKSAQQSVQREFEFNRGVSHELRSPIQVALNSTELLTINNHDLTYAKPMQRLKRAITQMEQISEAFLWLASERSLDKESTDARQVIQTLKSHYAQHYQHNNIVIQQQSQETILYQAPLAVFTVVIDNLIRNALQHGTSGDILINLKHNSIQIINPQSSQIYEKEQLHNPLGGYGIGLMIVKRICQRLNWQLTLIPHNKNMNCVEISQIKQTVH